MLRYLPSLPLRCAVVGGGGGGGGGGRVKRESLGQAGGRADCRPPQGRGDRRMAAQCHPEWFCSLFLLCR
jgi:hypothetical protein